MWQFIVIIFKVETDLCGLAKSGKLHQVLFKLFVFSGCFTQIYLDVLKQPTMFK
jgi:hypothetical protein